jgi:hypothetical protein
LATENANMNDISRRCALAAVASGVGVLGSARAVGLAAEPPKPQGEQRPRVDHYTTPADGELVPSLTLAFDPCRYTTLYILRLPRLRKGDVIQAHCQFELTHDLGFNVMAAHAMLLHSKQTIVKDGNRPEGHVLCEYAGENITPGMHHGFRTLMGSLAAADDGDAWVGVLIYAASDAAQAGDTLSVMKGYGGLRVVVFRNIAEPAAAVDRAGSSVPQGWLPTRPARPLS